MKLTITLERGDAVLGSIDFDLMTELIKRAFEEAMARTIYDQMPDGGHELYAGLVKPGQEERVSGADFEVHTMATIRWMLRHFKVCSPGVELPEANDWTPSRTLKWPVSEHD